MGNKESSSHNNNNNNTTNNNTGIINNSTINEISQEGIDKRNESSSSHFSEADYAGPVTLNNYSNSYHIRTQSAQSSKVMVQNIDKNMEILLADPIYLQVINLPIIKPIHTVSVERANRKRVKSQSSFSTPTKSKPNTELNTEILNNSINSESKNVVQNSSQNNSFQSNVTSPQSVPSNTIKDNNTNLVQSPSSEAINRTQSDVSNDLNNNTSNIQSVTSPISSNPNSSPVTSPVILPQSNSNLATSDSANNINNLSASNSTNSEISNANNENDRFQLHTNHVISTALVSNLYYDLVEHFHVDGETPAHRCLINQLRLMKKIDNLDELLTNQVLPNVNTSSHHVQALLNEIASLSTLESQLKQCIDGVQKCVSDMKTIAKYLPEQDQKEFQLDNIKFQ